MRDGKARALAVDDDEKSREIIHVILQNQGKDGRYWI